MANKQIDGFHGPATLVSVTEMGSLSVVVVQPGIEIGLEQLDTLVEDLPQLDRWHFQLRVGPVLTFARGLLSSPLTPAIGQGK